ncbi:hypothetical protein [Clostridium estertheticum]|uniref:hypothetical protein n=1 Tax=Clostridium estertheticum TaxID=238834 RepID=UPI001CF22328|nr:hypothetical protein [Clostridium estertheticum]MCB2354718.1 hypothetical protein [Clostridium estertheticum]WAG40960.1 hypothetical protein LL065_22400 [Clostridium estertheticum]
MFKLALVINKDTHNPANIKMTTIELNELYEVLIPVNPVYDWLVDNAANINYELLKGFITNIIPLGDAGKNYFKIVANKKTGFTKELWNLYIKLEKMYYEGNLKISSYLELTYLGYTGGLLGGKCPVDDVIKYDK